MKRKLNHTEIKFNFYNFIIIEQSRCLKDESHNMIMCRNIPAYSMALIAKIEGDLYEDRKNNRVH